MCPSGVVGEDDFTRLEMLGFVAEGLVGFVAVASHTVIAPSILAVSNTETGMAKASEAALHRSISE